MYIYILFGMKNMNGSHELNENKKIFNKVSK